MKNQKPRNGSLKLAIETAKVQLKQENLYIKNKRDYLYITMIFFRIPNKKVDIM